MSAFITESLKKYVNYNENSLVADYLPEKKTRDLNLVNILMFEQL